MRDEKEIEEVYNKLKAVFESNQNKSSDPSLTDHGMIWADALLWVMGDDNVLDMRALIDNYDPEKHGFKSKVEKETDEFLEKWK